MIALSPYERKALIAIEEWKSPEHSFFSRAMNYVDIPLDFVGDFVLKTPWLGDALQKSVKGVLSVANDTAQYTVRSRAIIAEFSAAGHQVSTLQDIRSLDLEDVDTMVGWLSAKYKALAAAEGVGTGLMGAPGIAIDVPALLSINFRAIGEFATYYGFEIGRQEERIFALAILHYAASPKDASKGLLMAEIAKVTKQAASKKTWEKLNQSALVKIVEAIATKIGIKLTKGKLAQSIPLVGAGVGGSFNAYFTAKVCDAAYYYYRERFIKDKERRQKESSPQSVMQSGSNDEIEDAEFTEVEVENVGSSKAD
ncbi:EcsC family protein [Sphingobium sp. EM0848]|uniref:EcsC family protein n=1 Tax=Sphingobium sp. EM0848 TaxID=2743473 RepID=UPI00159C1C63|nr:EcsC family protein [Sphingobium sp. EM0848]